MINEERTLLIERRIQDEFEEKGLTGDALIRMVRKISHDIEQNFIAGKPEAVRRLNFDD